MHTTNNIRRRFMQATPSHNRADHKLSAEGWPTNQTLPATPQPHLVALFPGLHVVLAALFPILFTQTWKNLANAHNNFDHGSHIAAPFGVLNLNLHLCK
jgi:hypothetical protein